jgi:hypothetical protein
MRRAARQAILRARPLSRSAAATGILLALALTGANVQVEPIKQVAARISTKALASATPTMNAFGASGEVRVRFARPGAAIEMPLQVAGDPTSLRYEWLTVDDSAPVSEARPLAGAEVVTPENPGLYRIALSAPGAPRRVVHGVTVGVLVPFEEKQGRTLNGYRMGMWRGERNANAKAPLPAGFLEVQQRDLDRPLTRHIRVSDFLTHDSQSQWPRYLAVDTRALDKLELVLAQLEADQGGAPVGGEAPRFAMEVRSGFRTPFHNAQVPGSARDSRHQSGEALDVAIDADRDGRFTRKDLVLVVKAIEEVEEAHPDLVGGIGMYVSRRFSSPYVHMDVRGDHVRWRG